MSTENRLLALVKETITTPVSGVETLRRLPWTPQSALNLNILVVAVSVLSQQLVLMAVNAMRETPVEPLLVSPGPFADAGFMAALSLFLILGIWTMGTVNGRDTKFMDVAVMYGWFQLLLIAAQIVLVPISLVLPPIGALLAVMLALFAQPYYLVCGVMAVHKFEQPLPVLGGLVLVGLVAALLLTPVILLLGIEFTGLTNV